MTGAGTERAAQAARDWPHLTSRFRALDHHFVVRTNDRTLCELIDRVLVDLADGTAGDPMVYTITCAATDAAYTVAADGERLVRTAHPAQALGYLTWDVNRKAVERSPDRVRLHAAVAERDGAGVVLPAAMESGKTTLVAGLVRAGFGYLSDEIAAVDPLTHQVHPYPKPLSIDPGSWAVLADLAPDVTDEIAAYLEQQWLVPVSAIRPDAPVARSVPPRLVITPKYTPGAPTTLVPVSRAEMLVLAAEQTFGFAEDPAGNLEVLAAVLQESRCYRLTVSDLDRACALVAEAAADLTLR